jgi:hypothetical protein
LEKGNRKLEIRTKHIFKKDHSFVVGIDGGWRFGEGVGYGEGAGVGVV